MGKRTVGLTVDKMEAESQKVVKVEKAPKKEAKKDVKAPKKEASSE